MLARRRDAPLGAMDTGGRILDRYRLRTARLHIHSGGQ